MEINDYRHIKDYDFSDKIFKNFIAVSFKIEKIVEPYDFLTLFHKNIGERFALKTPDKKNVIVGIGNCYNFSLDTNDFLTNYSNNSVVLEFQNVMSQTTQIKIDDFTNDYFGIYGGVSSGDNKNYQEWIDFSDTTFKIPNILAVFEEKEILFTLFFKKEVEKDFSEIWHERISFLEKIENKEYLPLEETKLNQVREIYPEVLEDNIKSALEKIKNKNFKRIALSRKDQLVVESKVFLPAIMKYFMEKNLYFIAYESKKSMFITSNPLLSFSSDLEFLKLYLYLQKENLFNGFNYIDFKEDDIEKDFKLHLEEKTESSFTLEKEKILIGKNLDIYSVFKTKTKGINEDIKKLSLLYPITIIKGHPIKETEEFLKEKENIGYGFWYYPFGFINHKFESNFYTCGNMMVAFDKIITLFSSVFVDEDENYEKIKETSDKIVDKNLKLFK